MRKALTILVLMAFLVACTVAPAPKEPAAPAADVAPAPEPVKSMEEERKPVLEDDTAARLAKEQEQKIIETLESPPKLPPRDRTTAVEQMWNTFTTLSSYQFKTPQGAYFVRGDKIKSVPFNAIVKHDFSQGSQFWRQIYIDEIILDRGAKTATGYCAGLSQDVNRQCANLQLHDVPFTLSYDEFATKLPEDWVKEYINQIPTHEEAEKYYLKSLLTTRVQFKDGTEMSFFPKAGLPVQIIPQGRNLDKIIFDDIVVNQVRPEDIAHRSKKDIPVEEQFYKPRY